MQRDQPNIADVTHGDLPPAELERALEHASRWVREYLSHPERVRVLPNVKPGDVRRSLPSSPPQRGEPLEQSLADFERVIVPAITHWNHPSFFGYFATSSSAPGIVGELLSATLDVKAMLWRTSPAATELEQVVVDWLRQLVGMGDGWFGMTTDTASISTMLALAAARERAGFDIRARGMSGRTDLPVLRVYTSEHSHSSVDKAAIALGLGHENVVHVPADAEFRMRPAALQSAIDADVARGFHPLAVVSTAGTTSSASVDPVREIAAIATRAGAWHHVDSAYAGVAAIAPELRWVLDGVELADSVVLNPHKWLFTPMDCSVLYTRHPDVLRQAFALVPEYLTTTDELVDSVNYMDYGVQLGRRFRALKLWMVIRSFGAEGLASRIRFHCALATDFAEWVSGAPGWSVVAPLRFSLVCFRYAPASMSPEEADRLNAAIMERVNASGEAFLSHTRLEGRYVLRLAIGNIRTELRDVARVWELLRGAVVETLG